MPLFAEARKALGLGNDPVTPAEVMTAILKAEVDLLWFGGIGTYVRGSDETDAEAGDKANDAIRIAGRDIRAKVVGEGANLAVTQKGRVDYALHGGRLDTDAIDNSAGVNASDIEVNVKIAMNYLLRTGGLDMEGRNAFLAQMTDEVAALCLRNNYLQPLAMSLAAARRRRRPARPSGADRESRSARPARPRGRVSARRCDDRCTSALGGEALTRPELATILAYAKNSLYADLLASKAPDDAYLGHELFTLFPAEADRALHGRRGRPPAAPRSDRDGHCQRHDQSRRPGVRRQDDGGDQRRCRARSPPRSRLARDAYGLERLYNEIDALDGQISGATQLALYAEIADAAASARRCGCCATPT